MSKTRHLDTAISILKGSPAAKRAKSDTLKLTIMGDHAVLQSPRGKTIAQFYGNRDIMVRDAGRKALTLGKNMEVFDA